MGIWFFGIKKRKGKSDPVSIFSNYKDIIVLSNVFNSGGDGDAYREGRIVFIDKINGELTGRILLSDEIREAKIYGHLIVLDCGCRLYVLDQTTKKWIFSNAILLKSYPLLKNEGIYSIDFNQESQSFSIKSKKDNNSTITLQSLTDKHIEIEAIKRTKEINYFSIIGQGKLDYKGTLFEVDVDLLKPKKIFETEEFCVVMNRKDITETGDFSLVKFGNDGKTQWIIQRSKIYNLFPADFKLNFVESNGTDLIVGIKANWSRLFCIDIQSGKINWNYRI